MSLYDEIRSPLDDVETLKSIVDIFLKCRGFEGEFYDELIAYEKEKNSKDDYKREFDKYIMLPNLDKIYEIFQGIDREKTDEWVKSYEKDPDFGTYIKRYMYPLDRFDNIFKRFKTYSDFYDLFNRNKETKPELYALFEKMSNSGNRKDTYRKEIREKGLAEGLSEKQLDTFETMFEFKNLMEKQFYGGERSYGIPY